MRLWALEPPPRPQISVIRCNWLLLDSQGLSLPDAVAGHLPTRDYPGEFSVQSQRSHSTESTTGNRFPEAK